jgi:NAD(P)-dependent dehydrogenase (short-subunit alcohol dehydrogenase family)
MGTWRTLAAAVAVAAAAVALHSHTTHCPNLPGVRGSVVLITGASSGIGAELAVQYGALGARLVLAARRGAELRAVGAAASAAGAEDVLTVPSDMADASAVRALVDGAVARFGRLDVLLLNHATVADDLLVTYNTHAALEAAIGTPFRVNVMGSTHAARAALPHLEAAAGHIAVVSSASAKVAAPFHAGYVASKHALHGVFETLRAELHLLRSNVTVGLLVLGMIATPEVLRDPALAGMAAPVPAVASEMICAIQARWPESYVPAWYKAWTLATALGGDAFAEWVMVAAYISKVERYAAAVREYTARWPWAMEAAAVQAAAAVV